MELDQKAITFLQKAKASGQSKDQAMQFLASKGYDVGVQAPTQQPIVQESKYTPENLQLAQATIQRRGLDVTPEQFLELSPEQKQQLYKGGQKLARDQAKLSDITAEEWAQMGGQAARTGLRTGAKILADAPTLGMGGGYVDEAEAYLRSKLGNETYEQALSDIEREEAERSGAEKAIETGARIGSSILGGAALGKALPGVVGKLGGAAGRTAAGGISAYGESQGDLASTLAGAGLGLVSPAIGKAAGKVAGAAGKAVGKVLPKGVTKTVKKGVEKVLDKVSKKTNLPTGSTGKKLRDVMAETGGIQELSDVAGSQKGFRALKSAVQVDDDIARKVYEQADDALMDAAERTKDIVRKELGADAVEKNLAEASEMYRDSFKRFGKQSLGDDLYDSPALKEMAQEVKQMGARYGDEVAEYADESLLVAQQVKERLDDEVDSLFRAGKSKQASQVAKARDRFVNKIENKVPQYGQMKAQYAKAKQADEVIKNITQSQGKIDSNLAKSYLSRKNRDLVAGVYGNEAADQLFTQLRKESRNIDKVAKLQRAADSQLTKVEKTLGERAGGALGGARELIRSGVNIATGGAANRAKRQLAQALLEGNRDVISRELTPLGKALSATTAGRIIGGE